MLYSIIPPILVVLSLIGIIMLLMRKSKEVANLSPEEIQDKDEEIISTGGFLGGKLNLTRYINGNNVKHFFLAISEKITRKLRVLFLKLESKSANLSNAIREKRKLRFSKSKQEVSFQRENDIIKKVEEYTADNEEKVEPTRPVGGEEIAEAEEIIETEKPEAPKKENLGRSFFTREKAPKIEIEKMTAPIEVEKEVKPIISERIVKPRAKTEIRDRLEELLIERIAINPKDIEAYERLGEYYLEIKSYTDSKECFKQVMKLDPKNRNAKYRMRRLENLLARG